MKFKIGTYTKKGSEGIYQAEIHHDQIQNIQLVAQVDNPTFIAETKNTLFSVVKAGSEGGIAALRQGQLINQVVEPGAPPCYVSIDSKNGLIYSANYHGGRINSYRFDEEKGLMDVQKIHFGEDSKAHYIQYAPSLDEVIVCDLGKDKVYFFKVFEDQLVLAHTFVSSPKSGPRHVVVHPNQKLVYVFTELSSELIVLKRTETGTEVLQKISTLPANVVTPCWGAAIRMSKDARFIYVSNRAHDSITVFANLGEHVEWVQNILTQGVQPRDFNLSPDDRYLVCGNLDSDTLTLFGRDEATGVLSLLQKDVKAFESVCILFEE